MLLSMILKIVLYMLEYNCICSYDLIVQAHGMQNMFQAYPTNIQLFRKLYKTYSKTIQTYSNIGWDPAQV